MVGLCTNKLGNVMVSVTPVIYSDYCDDMDDCANHFCIIIPIVGPKASVNVPT